MIMKSMMAASVAVALLATPLIAQTAKDGKPGEEAQTFVTKAANGGMFEVESSKLALDKAQRADVKGFAQKMVTDHGKANKELEQVAGQIGAKVPDKMDSAHQGRLDKLKGASAQTFDSVYIQAQDEAHREAVTLFDNYAKTGANSELKSFASKTLPVLQQHAAEVKKLEQASSKGATGGSTGGSSK